MSKEVPAHPDAPSSSFTVVCTHILTGIFDLRYETEWQSAAGKLSSLVLSSQSTFVLTAQYCQWSQLLSTA